MRYRQLIDIVKELKPKIVLEIGTHKAARPIEWYGAHPFEHYYGFDLFEDGTSELNVAEMNGKGFCSAQHAQKVLGDIPNSLYQGLTVDTLPSFKKLNPDIQVDFAFIDGGHSVATIKNDWEHVKDVMSPNGVVVFDDYYVPARHGYGCNKLMQELPHLLLPQSDQGVFLARVDIADFEMPPADTMVLASSFGGDK